MSEGQTSRPTIMEILIGAFWRLVAIVWQLIPSSQRPTRNIGGENKDMKDVVKLFQIPLIMTKVVKSLSQKDMIQLRSTSKLWNNIMLTELQKNDSPRCIISGECGGVVKRLGSLARTLRQNSSTSDAVPLITDLEICTYRDTDAKCKLFTHAPVIDLFSVSGSYLTRLEIKVDSTTITATNRRIISKPIIIAGLRDVLFNLTPALIELSLTWVLAPEWEDADTANEDKLACKELPRLRKLKLRLGDFEYMKRLQNDLIRSAAKLTSLNVRGSRANLPQLAIQSLCINPMACHFLQELNICFGTGDTVTQTLLELLTRARIDGLKITQFTVKINLRPGQRGWGRHERERLTQITEFFSSQAMYMKELSVKVCDDSTEVDEPNEQFGVQIPQLDKLESLAIKVMNPAAVKFECCPILNSLSLQYTAHEANAWGRCLSPFSTSPVHELNTTAGSNEGIENVKMVNILALYFPCLTRLTTNLRRGCLSPVWLAWPLLECLDLTVSIDEDPKDRGELARYLDHDLTGISAEQCALLRGRIAAGEIDCDYEEAMRTKSSPGITDLKALRQFALTQLTHNSAYRKIEVTDVTGYFAFAAPESKLQQISIQEGANFSDKCRAAIQQRLGLVANCQFN